MKDFEVIPIEERQDKECYFCGSDKSVCYTAVTYDRELNNGELTRVYCCQKCLFEELDRRVKNKM